MEKVEIKKIISNNNDYDVLMVNIQGEEIEVVWDKLTNGRHGGLLENISEGGRYWSIESLDGDSFIVWV